MQSLKLDNLESFYPAVDETKLANVSLRLSRGRCLTSRQEKRRTAELKRRAKAAEQIGRLPARDESLHCILNGEFALWDFVPAAVELAGQPVDSLTVATLGFSKANCEALDQMLTEGQVKQVEGVLCSHFFAAATIDGEIFGHMAELADKYDFRLAAMRTHAKLLLMSIGERRLVVESSANLRSCHNVEQATLFDDPQVYDFHHSWVTELLQQGAK